MKESTKNTNGNGNRIVVTTKGSYQAEGFAMFCCWSASTTRA